MAPGSAQRLYRLATLVVVVVSCRRVPPAADTTAVPVTRSDTTHQRLPEPYEYLGQVGVSLNSIDSIRARLPYDSIYLRREPCFGACPMYEATLYRDGSARYKGERFVERVGSYRGEVTIQDYGRMSYLLDKLEFMSLPDSFAVAATDLPGATMVVARRPQGVKAVHDYGYVGPVELWTLMEVFDGIVNRIQWQKSGP